MTEQLTDERRQELLARLERAETEAEISAIEAALGMTQNNTRWTVATLAEVAGVFGVHEQTIKSWRAEGMPGQEGAWPCNLIAQWRIAKAEKRGLAVGNESGQALLREKTRIDIERKQLELDEQKGLLGRKDELLADVTEAFAAVRVRLEALPSEMASGLPPEIRDATLADWRDRIRVTLKELASFGSAADESNTTSA